MGEIRCKKYASYFTEHLWDSNTFKKGQIHCCPQLPQLLPEETRDLHIMQLTVRGALLGSVKRAEGTSNCVYRRAVKPGNVLQVKSACCITEDTTSSAVLFPFWRLRDTVDIWPCLALLSHTIGPSHRLLRTARQCQLQNNWSVCGPWRRVRDCRCVSRFMQAASKMTNEVVSQINPMYISTQRTKGWYVLCTTVCSDPAACTACLQSVKMQYRTAFRSAAAVL
jgi:hypothetical protein